ncbi:D-amino acid dehydrogenase [Sinorhizobium terangae]|uniref:D-amino acid dehydrogenase n=1 Tax=Sinorhizobium terangae TaxID=110322 RepID=UPI0024B0599C|nr:D-amino acid dehydrogenase [Sinorhizobium terangae]WFU49115.1 D-amino acid dehydrogenase [Sinorhizobium terangae]
MPHIVVLGAGITGVTTAYALLQRGHRVTVVDRHRYPAMETSFANGGQLSASNAEVWTNWATIRKGIGWMLKKDAPLLLNPLPGWHKYSWLAEFTANIPHYEDNTIETTRLAIAARKHLFAVAENEGIDFDLERRGILHVYYDKPSFDAALAVNELLRRGGLDRRAVTPTEISAIEPTLLGSFYGGFFTPSDSTGDIHKFTRGLADACQRKGAEFIPQAEITGVEANGSIVVTYRAIGDPTGEAQRLAADAVVVCAGVGSRHLAALLGDRINVYPVKGYSITVHLDDEKSRDSAPWVSMLDDRAKIVTSRLGIDRFRVAGTAEFNGPNRDIRHDRVKPLIAWVERLFPHVSTSRVVPWSGLRPMMPNMMPRVRRGKRPNVFYNTGHGHLGWTLSCVTAEMVADLVDTDPATNFRRA